MQPRAFLVCVVAVAGCDGGGFPADGGVPDAPASGTFSLAWTVTDPGGAPIACDQIGANTVALTLQSLDRVFGLAESFSCANSPSTSPPIPVGAYTVDIELHGAGLDPVVSPRQNRITINQNQTTALQAVTFAVQATGMLALKIATPAPFTSSCGAAPGGAAITGETITVQNDAGTCLPITFTRMKGGAPNGTYTVSCTAPSVATCIEGDETLTASDVPSGAYQIHIRGKRDATDCFRNDDSLSLPAQGKTLTRTLNLAPTTPSC
jgi:hypothetical protein